MLKKNIRPTLAGRLINLIAALANLYLVLFTVWALLYLYVGDRWWWLFLLTSVAFWLALPLLIIAPLALVIRRRALQLSAGSGVLLGLVLFGAQALPAIPPVSATGRSQLTVMSFNVYAGHSDPSNVAAIIGASGADVVALQELSFAMSAQLKRDLATIYPYQLLDPQPMVMGMGVLSRYPLRDLGTLPGDDWFGKPQIVGVDLSDQEVIVLNFHAIPPLVWVEGGPSETIRERERQAEAIVALAAMHNRPFIALGDLNATMHHDAYRIINADLADAWNVRGGLGFTWPAPNVRTPPFPILRIDHIFHSDHWQPISASVGTESAGSDHLPIIATLGIMQGVSERKP